MLLRRLSLSLAIILMSAVVARAGADNPMIIDDNMKILHCAEPTAANRFLGSNAPGQLFYADESATVNLALAKGVHTGKTPLKIEIQEIGTRTPGNVTKTMDGFSDTAGHAPLLDLVGKPATFDFDAVFDDKPEAAVELKNFPLPKRFGTYALILVDGSNRTFLGTLGRVVQPREGGTFENTPMLGEIGLFDAPAFNDERAACYERMGIHGMRQEVGWIQHQDGATDWSNFDAFYPILAKHKVQIMVTLGGAYDWARPFGQPTPASGWTPQTGGYGGTGDWVMDPKYYPRYGKWVAEYATRYWQDGHGALWGFENYNEPWEGGGISGWARDCLEYRKIQKTIADSARSVDPRIRVCAASSIMNTEDKLFSDGSREFEKYVDIFTDHYVLPMQCYGPMVAKSHGKISMETETWFVASEYLLPQVVQFIASGQARLSPWHPRVLFDHVPGVDDHNHVPTPVVIASAAFNHFLTGKSFEKMPFKDHLPWVFQFGKDNDKEGVLIVLGQLISIGSDDAKGRLWSQVDASDGGTMTIDNADGLLEFYDLAGNPTYVGDKIVTLPMTIYPSYITCAKGPAAAAARLAKAKIEGKRPVEILPRDFNQLVSTPGLKLNVEIHNCLTNPVSGSLSAKTTSSLKLKTDKLSVELAPGETKTVSFEFAGQTADPTNAYPFDFSFTSDAGSADYSETMHAAVAPKRTFTIDGNLDKWKDVPGLSVVAYKTQKADAAEMMRRPWLDLKDQHPDGNFAEFKMAWDENFLYFAARVNDPTPQPDAPKMEGRDENQFFHTAASDKVSPYKEFLEKYPGRSFAEVPYVYCKSPEGAIPFRRDRLQIALDVSDDWHDLTPDTDKVPYGFHAVPDTDYEYSLYQCTGGAELWRQLAPGVPRIHDFPRQPRGPLTTGPVPGAKYVVNREGNVYTYELAIPKTELAKLKLAPGTVFGAMLRAGNNQGPNVDSAQDKAVTKLNGLTMHPYWEPKLNCGVKWTLVE